MNKILATTLALFSALIASQSANAQIKLQQHHSGDGSILSLGSYSAFCPFANQGSAVADMRNVNSNGHNKQVVHLKAQGTTSALAFLANLNSVLPVIYTPITFTVQKGNAKYLQILVQYTPHNSSTSIIQGFVTPDSKLSFPGVTLLPLISYGNGKYGVPVGQNGIPQGSELDGLAFAQSANRNNCSNHASNIYELQIGRKFVPLAADPQSTCGTGCGDGEGDGGVEE